MSAQVKEVNQTPEPKRGLSFKFDLRAYAMLVALVAIWIFFYLNTDGQFLTPRNMSNLAVQMSVTSILAVGMVLVMVAGHIDLSVGAVLGLAGGIAAIAEVWWGWPTWAALGAAILVLLTVLPHEQWILTSLELPPSPEADRVIFGLRAVAVLAIIFEGEEILKHDDVALRGIHGGRGGFQRARAGENAPNSRWGPTERANATSQGGS